MFNDSFRLVAMIMQYVFIANNTESKMKHAKLRLYSVNCAGKNEPCFAAFQAEN